METVDYLVELRKRIGQQFIANEYFEEKELKVISKIIADLAKKLDCFPDYAMKITDIYHE